MEIGYIVVGNHYKYGMTALQVIFRNRADAEKAAEDQNNWSVRDSDLNSWSVQCWEVE